MPLPSTETMASFNVVTVVRANLERRGAGGGAIDPALLRRLDEISNSPLDARPKSAGRSVVSDSALQFRRSPAVSAEVRASVVSGLLAGEPALRDWFEKRYPGDAFVRSLDRTIADGGGSSTNLGDVAYLFVATSLVIAHGRRFAPEQAQALRRDVIAALAENRNVTRMSDRDRQITAETLLYQIAFNFALMRAAQARSDAPAQAQIRTNLASAAASVGFNLARLATPASR